MKNNNIMKETDIDLLLDGLGRQAAIRRAAAADCADLDSRLADGMRRHRRGYNILSTALPVALLLAVGLLAGTADSTAAAMPSVECNAACSPDAVMADADAVIDSWLANV